MGAIGGRPLATMFLHPLQYGGRNLGKVYCMNLEQFEEVEDFYIITELIREIPFLTA